MALRKTKIVCTIGPAVRDLALLKQLLTEGLNPELVLISGVPDALSTFENDLIVSMDGEQKLIYEGVVEEK